MFALFRIFIAFALAIVLLTSGCTSKTRVNPAAASSAAPTLSAETAKLPSNPDDDKENYAREFPDQASRIRSGKDFTVIPPGTYTPLPPDDLLGARTLKERDEILEVMVRHLARKPGHDIKYRFLSFQGDRGAAIVHDHDPHQELLQRIHDLGLPILPVSARKESRMEHGWRIDSKQGEYGVEYSIVYIQVAEEDSAEVGVNEMPGFSHGGQRFTYTIKRSNGRWTVASEKAGPRVSANQPGTSANNAQPCC